MTDLYFALLAYLADTNMALTLGRSKKMTELSLDQLSYLAARARLPEQLVLDAARDTVARFLERWDVGGFVSNQASDLIEPINRLLGTIPIIK